MIRLFRMAGRADTRTRQINGDVCSSCNICKQFRKTRPRPKVAMSKANTVNEVVSLDLKEKRELKCHILYCVDEFSGYIKAAVIKNKEPETILKVLTKIWIMEGPGQPSKGWFSDNGGEFRNSTVCISKLYQSAGSKSPDWLVLSLFPGTGLATTVAVEDCHFLSSSSSLSLLSRTARK